MGLLSGSTVVLVAVLAVAVPVTTLLVWNRLGSNVAVRIGARVLLIVLSQGLAVLLAGLMLNRSYDFYTSWSELFGKASLTTATSRIDTRTIDTLYAKKLRVAYRDGHGTLVPWVIPGTVSKIPARPALIYLPAAYGNPATPFVRFPVVELIGGVPSTPHTWIAKLNVQNTLDRLIRSGQSLPFVAVIPTMNIWRTRDTECVNIARGGPQVDTYLTKDVRTSVIHAVRVQSGANAWGIAGFSTGGYCALNLAMRHPDMYSAAVSMSGYARPAQDRTTGHGRLFYGSQVLLDRNTPLWEARHWRKHRRPVSVLAISSRNDPGSFRDTVDLAVAARGDPALRITEMLLASGGHNTKLWTNLEPVAFNWLSRHLTPPLAGVTIRAHLLRIRPPVHVRTVVPAHRARQVASRRPGKARSSPALAHR